LVRVPIHTVGHPQVATGREQDDEEGVHHLHPGHHLLLPLLRLLRVRRLRERRAGEPPHRLRLLRALLAHRLRQRLHHPPPARRLPGVQPADLPVRGQALRGAVPGERVRERLPHGEGAAAAALQGKPPAGVLPDGVRGEHDGRGHLLPLLQRDPGAAGRAQLLAAGHLLPRGDVLHPAEGAPLVHQVAPPPGLQHRLPAHQRLRARRLHPGGHQPEARLV
uniref:Uncharacterized protein n=1 Tax=Aegilops tauschii subsp. strangulata TaxID=200361 RepID=A0A453C6V5_AEGTS